MKIKLSWYACQYVPTLNQWGRLQIAHLALDLNFYQSLCRASIEGDLNLKTKKGTTRHVFIQRICNNQTSIKKRRPIYKLSNMEDATNTFNNLLPQWQSSISINACHCITIFWRNPNNFHNARFMNLEEYQCQIYHYRFYHEKLVKATAEFSMELQCLNQGMIIKSSCQNKVFFISINRAGDEGRKRW